MSKKKQEIIRTLSRDEIPQLTVCLEKLAAYHNRVALDFRGVYPVMPIATHIMHMQDHVSNGTAVIVGLFLSDGLLGGFGMASSEGEYGEIDYVYIDETFRGGGRGGRIMDVLLGSLRERGVVFVDINVVKGNPAAKFYKRYGFRTRTQILSMRI